MSDELEDYLAASGKPDPSGSGGRAADVLTAVAMVGAEIGELRAHLGDVLRDMTSVREDLAGLRQTVDGLTDLSQRVSDLAIAVDELAQQGTDKAPKPVDLAHVEDADRAGVLEELANWVRTILFSGWPWTQDLIRGCWPHHPSLVNDLLLLKISYETAYATKNRRAHHAVDFRHLLDYITTAADEQTRDCPTDPAQHPVTLPARNDLAAMHAVTRDMVLARVWRLTEQANRARALGQTDLAEAAQVAAAEAFEEHHISPAEYQAYERRVHATRTAHARHARQAHASD